MKTFLKVFLISFCIFTLVLGGAIYAFFREPSTTINPVMPDNGNGTLVDSIEGSGNMADKSGTNSGDSVKEPTELEKLVDKSPRVNVLVVGLEGPRTDTLILASFNPKTQQVDLISIPRDTYNKTPGYDAYDQKKINAVYGRKNGGGPEGVMKAVANVVNVPVHYYVIVKYDGVENIIDTLGGVQVNVPFDMDYEDPWDDPPLVIKLNKGTQTLNGEKAIQFLRFRRNSDGSHNDGDIARIKRQKQFIKSAMRKALSFKLPALINTAFDYVKTNMTIKEMGYYARCAVGLTPDSIKTYLIPYRQTDNNSYYFHDEEATEALMIQIYKN